MTFRPVKRRAGGADGRFPSALGLRASAPGGQSGAVTVVQRASSDLRLNAHFHAVFLDGVFTAGEDQPAFHELPRLRTDEVADVLQVVRVRILRTSRVAG